MQDYAGLPALLDLAALREIAAETGMSPLKVSPSLPVVLVVDHSIIVESAGLIAALSHNQAREHTQNKERFRFLKWAQSAFPNVRIIPPGKGILHQINLEHLSVGVSVHQLNGQNWAYPDTVLGTDSHSTMVGGIGLLGWGVGGIEATACLLGKSVSLQWPKVVGVRLFGTKRSGVLASDIALHLTRRLRSLGVIECFVEFTGPGLCTLNVSDRATIANMAPEYGATVAFFPTDSNTINYFSMVGHSRHQMKLIEGYAKAQGLWQDEHTPDPEFETMIEINLSEINTTFAGPNRPEQALAPAEALLLFPPKSASRCDELQDGDVVLAAITSCTNTANPEAMITAGLVAKRAVSLGLSVTATVKTSFAPGSQVVTRYLQASGLLSYLEQLGFAIVGYGCTTCVGNSGPLNADVQRQITEQNLNVCAVLSGNRNFEGRIHKSIQSSFLMSPPHVIIAALAGHMRLDLEQDVLAVTPGGKSVRLDDLWPPQAEVEAALGAHLQASNFREVYARIDHGGPDWMALDAPTSATFDWDPTSSYIRRPAPINDMGAPDALTNARALLLLGDNITTDHISPVGAIDPRSPAGQYLMSHGVERGAFNTYGARRGNHEIMLRGTYANPHLCNQFVPDQLGGWTLGPDAQMILSIYDAAIAFQNAAIPTIICAGLNYGNGSARDWAAKGTAGLGVRAVIARSFERIHRTNLALCGVLPVILPQDVCWEDLSLAPEDRLCLDPLSNLAPGAFLNLTLKRTNGQVDRLQVNCEIRTSQELEQYRAGGVLAAHIQQMRKASKICDTNASDHISAPNNH